MQYVEFANNVRRTKAHDSRGSYRIRYNDPRTGQSCEARRIDVKDADLLCYELSNMIPQVLRQRADGEMPDSEVEVETRTVEDLVEWHLSPASRVKAWAEQTLRSKQAVCRVRINPRFGHLEVGEVTRKDALLWINELRDEGLADLTIIGYLAIFKTMIAEAYRDGWMPADPLHDVHPGQVLSSVRIAGESASFLDPTGIPDEAAILRLVEVIKAQTATRYVDQWYWYMMPWLAAEAGLRLGEVCGLTPEDFDFKRGIIRVDRQVLESKDKTALPKYRKRRTTIIPPRIADDLRRRCAEVEPGAPLFTSKPGSWMRGGTFTCGKFKRARRDAGWPVEDGRYRWTFHSLRHYFCTWALSPEGLGLEVADVSMLAGHSTPSFTYDRYVSRRAGTLERAAAAARKAAS